MLRWRRGYYERIDRGDMPMTADQLKYDLETTKVPGTDRMYRLSENDARVANKNLRTEGANSLTKTLRKLGFGKLVKKRPMKIARKHKILDFQKEMIAKYGDNAYAYHTSPKSYNDLVPLNIEKTMKRSPAFKNWYDKQIDYNRAHLQKLNGKKVIMSEELLRYHTSDKMVVSPVYIKFYVDVPDILILMPYLF